MASTRAAPPGPDPQALGLSPGMGHDLRAHSKAIDPGRDRGNAEPLDGRPARDRALTPRVDPKRYDPPRQDVEPALPLPGERKMSSGR